MPELTLVGTIKTVNQATTGYGDKERTIGVKISAQVEMEDSLGKFTKDVEFTIPTTSAFRPYVGDVIEVVIMRPDDTSALYESPAPSNEEEDRDADLQGNPFYDEIKQGG